MTDHVKDQLCGRIEELEAEKMELNEQLDIAQQQRDALAAHVERLQGTIPAAVSSDWTVPAEEALEETLDDKAAASLARLKAKWQAEVLEHARDRVALAVEADTVRAHLRNQAAKLRRQAEGGEA